MRNRTGSPKSPSALEQLVMEFLWSHGPSTSEAVREGLQKRHPMKEATTRTILRRLEAKGYVEEGRTYVYSAVQPKSMAMRTIQHFIDRFWGGSAKALVVGMVEHQVIDPSEIRELSDKLDRLLSRRRK